MKILDYYDYMERGEVISIDVTKWKEEGFVFTCKPYSDQAMITNETQYYKYNDKY